MPLAATAGLEPFSSEAAWAFPFSAGAPGTGKELAGFQEIQSDPQTTEVEHRGNNRVLSKGSTNDSVDLTAKTGYWVLETIAAMVGGTVTTGGTTPNQFRKLVHAVTDQPADCAIQCITRSKSPDGGATRLTFPRCQPQGLPNYGFADQEYSDLEINMSAVPNGAGQLVIVEQLETYAALTSTYTVSP